jgi:hypothetical protein
VVALLHDSSNSISIPASVLFRSAAPPDLLAARGYTRVCLARVRVLASVQSPTARASCVATAAALPGPSLHSCAHPSALPTAQLETLVARTVALSHAASAALVHTAGLPVGLVKAVVRLRDGARAMLIALSSDSSDPVQAPDSGLVCKFRSALGLSGLKGEGPRGVGAVSKLLPALPLPTAGDFAGCTALHASVAYDPDTAPFSVPAGTPARLDVVAVVSGAVGVGRSTAGGSGCTSVWGVPVGQGVAFGTAGGSASAGGGGIGDRLVLPGSGLELALDTTVAGPYIACSHVNRHTPCVALSLAHPLSHYRIVEFEMSNLPYCVSETDAKHIVWDWSL